MGNSHGQRTPSQFEVVSRVYQGHQIRTVPASELEPDIATSNFFSFDISKEKCLTIFEIFIINQLYPNSILENIAPSLPFALKSQLREFDHLFSLMFLIDQ
jgi:hypothetical protein